MEDRVRTIVVRFREFFAARRSLALVICLLAAVFLLFVFAANQSRTPVRQAEQPLAPGWSSPNSEIAATAAVRTGGDNGRATSMALPPGMPSALYKSGSVDSVNSNREPQIAYSAELSVVTREFAHSRSSMEEILERHRGYTARLRMVGQPAGSVLTATLRVPSSEY